MKTRGPRATSLTRETHLCNDYAITLGGKISLSPFSRTEWLIIYKNVKNVSPRITLIYYVSSLVEIGPVVFKKTIFINFVNVNLILHYNPPLKRTKPFICKSLVDISPVVLEKKIFFKISLIYFLYFVIISPWKRTGLFICTNLNFIRPMMICTKFSWNWPSGSGVNKRPTGLNGHMSIRDFTLTACQKGSYLYINSPIIE